MMKILTATLFMMIFFVMLLQPTYGQVDCSEVDVEDELDKMRNAQNDAQQARDDAKAAGNAGDAQGAQQAVERARDASRQASESQEKINACTDDPKKLAEAQAIMNDTLNMVLEAQDAADNANDGKQHGQIIEILIIIIIIIIGGVVIIIIIILRRR